MIQKKCPIKKVDENIINLNNQTNQAEKSKQKIILNAINKQNEEFKNNSRIEEDKTDKNKNEQKMIQDNIENLNQSIHEDNLLNYTDLNYSMNSDSSTVKSVYTNESGFRNLGNTCFMNTCLQILIHTPPIISKLFSLKSSSRRPITESFLNLCKEVARNGRAVEPSDFKLTYNRRRVAFAGFGQHDTLEFFRFLLDDMSHELNKGNKNAPYKELKTENKSKPTCNREYDEYLKTKEDSPIVDIFYGQLATTYTCTCGKKSYSFQKFLDLPLLFTAKGDVNDFLENQFNEENIKWDSKCEQCKKATVHKKDLKISIFPEILVLSLQRFNPRTGSKNNSAVSFKEHLNLEKYADKECWNGNCNYSLYGIANHSGTPSFGHYYAYINVGGRWKEFNDSTVSGYSLEKSSWTAYVLFYIKDKST